jgi:formylglycine-generating enzyme required for sulfatase activity
MQLLGGVLHDAGNGCDRVNRLFQVILKKLGKKPSLPAAARCVGLFGEMLRDLVNDPRPDPGADYARLRHQVEGIFDPQRASRVHIPDRIAAADALGQVRRARAPRNSADYWVTIEGGTYPIGSSTDKDHLLYDPERYEWELAARQVTLDLFQIARDPVTVGEFEEFIDDGGYGEPKYWQAGGFAAYGSAPRGWDDQLRFHARPVVGVSWHEAMAFCVWAEQILPSEGQWEAAARGHAARRFPWGNSPPDQQRLNYDDNLGYPTPPGIFPGGSTPEGVCDLAGNVWEWCLIDPKDPAAARDRPKEPVARGESRVFRGGSWNNDAHNVRCAYRGLDHVENQYINLGFRLVRVQKS